jgi:hypothetical protein
MCWPQELARISHVHALLADQAAADAGLFQHLADGRIIRQLASLDVATWR